VQNSFMIDRLRAYFNQPPKRQKLSTEVLKRKSSERQKLIDALKRHPVLRFVGAYPLPPDLNLRAKSVVQAISRFGSNAPLATLRLDTFRAAFISEKEGANLLVPLEHALALKASKQKRTPKAGKTSSSKKKAEKTSSNK
jgi:hypothetical protein